MDCLPNRTKPLNGAFALALCFCFSFCLFYLVPTVNRQPGDHRGDSQISNITDAHQEYLMRVDNPFGLFTIH